MELISRFKKGFFYYVSLRFSVNTHGFPLKDKTYITITNAFQKTLHQSNHKQSKICVDKGSEFYNRSIKLWLEGNNRNIFNT